MAHDELAHTIENLTDIGHLSAGVGHHVINAFSAIVSNAEIFRLTSNTPGAVDPAQVADLVVRTAVEASAVARRLIDYTRTATAVGNAEVHLEPLLTEVIQEERAGSQPEVSWGLELSPVPPITGHAIQLRAMMHHLIANAYESLPEAGGAITVSTAQDARGWVVVEVRDTGSGFDAGIMERAIEPFFTTKPGHFGVGLSIANGIWRRHKGTLALRSELGKGTTVRLCVEPIVRGDRENLL